MQATAKLVLVGAWLLLPACASVPPERAAHRELLLGAAADCRIRFPVIDRVEMDRFDRIIYYYRENVPQSQRDAFLACYREQVQDRTKAAAAGATAPPPSAASSRSEVAKPAPGGGPVVAIDVPTWKPGYEWSYRWENPRGSGTFVWSVIREETVDGFECYVVVSGRREMYWRKADLASVMEKVSGVIERRHVPPRLNMSWPLVPGKTWEQLYVFERPQDRTTNNALRTWHVDGTETVTVPAGTFAAIKITSRNKWTGSIAIETWYSPDIRQAVKTRDHLEFGIEMRELTSFKLD